jgi:hypothetical protein
MMSTLSALDAWLRDSGRDSRSSSSENRLEIPAAGNSGSIELLRQLESLIRRRPGQAIAAAIATGVLLGWLIKRW